MVFLPLSVLAAHSGLLTLLGYVPVIRNNPSSSLNNIIYSSKTSLKKKKPKTHTPQKNLQEVLRIWPLVLKENILEPNVLCSQSSFSFCLIKKFKCFQK